MKIERKNAKQKGEGQVLENIKAWLNDPDTNELSEKDKEILERLDFAYDQLKIDPPKIVARKMAAKFGYSVRNAQYDIQKCKILFNPINRRDVEWIRNFIIEDAILQIKAAREKLDMRAWNNARSQLLKLYIAEQKDKAEIDPEMLGNNKYYITVNFGNAAKKIDMNKLHELPEDKRLKLTEFLYSDINIEDAKEIMNS